MQKESLSYQPDIKMDFNILKGQVFYGAYYARLRQGTPKKMREVGLIESLLLKVILIPG